MRTPRAWLRLVAVLATAALVLANATPAQAVGHQKIAGTGSSWAANAIDVWTSAVSSNGLQVDFTSTGSAQGRKDFGNSTNDFGVSDIGYQGQDPLTHDTDLPCPLGTSTNCRDYAYLPIVAGGTAFAYHLQIGGTLIRNLRLSGQTLARIFTGGITSWSDPAITADNNGRKFPPLPVIPIVHAEGSGSTAQFTTYLANQYPSIWSSYAGRATETEYFPKGKNMVAQTNSDGVMNYIVSAAANGAIGYDEYSYALAKNYPVAKIKNSAGYFTLPTQFNVAVALQKAVINHDPTSKNYLLQDLRSVYTYGDKRTYTLSSYSYGIIPTSATDSRMITAKRQTLADFLYYSVCQGQAQIGPVGYSALPLNLVQDSFNQIAKLKAADPKVDLTSRNVTSCNNPTFTPGNLAHNHLADIAPLPPSCDQAGQGPCGGAGDPGTQIVGSNGSNGGSNGSSNNGGSNNGGGGSTNNAGGGGGATGKNAKPGAVKSSRAAKTVINPDTGQPVTVSGSSGDGSVVGQSTELADYRQQNMTNVLASLAALELLLALVAPPLVYLLLIRPRRRRAS
ncbi:MAG: substrate-binding domain-containing protein [Jatrophihabitantaceae bacterium]